jgi:hypothetical protein
MADAVERHRSEGEVVQEAALAVCPDDDEGSITGSLDQGVRRAAINLDDRLHQEVGVVPSDPRGETLDHIFGVPVPIGVDGLRGSAAAGEGQRVPVRVQDQESPPDVRCVPSGPGDGALSSGRAVDPDQDQGTFGRRHSDILSAHVPDVLAASCLFSQRP